MYNETYIFNYIFIIIRFIENEYKINIICKNYNRKKE